MFLFVVGLEIDIGYVRKNWKIASTVGLSSLIFPFCLGVALSAGLYNQYLDDEERSRVSFGVYCLFIGVAVAITAFPVLARILTELGLLRDRVGVVVLAAGISNDIIGWILLALTITLANSAHAINTLYIILLTIGWFIFLVWGVKPVLSYYLRKTGSIENGPSEMAVSVCILLCFVSAFYTDVIGVHPIFGAFLAGAIIPRDNHFVVKLTEKIEDFITLILLPLYFSLAGLAVNIGALNDGKSWGYVIAAIAVSMFGKIVGGMIPAKLHGLLWREAFTVGGLMSCKGIVEIVVLQLGYQAGILSVKVFSMFVIMALITTFITTPLTLKLYPMWYRTKVNQWRNGEIEWDGTPIHREESGNGGFKEFKLAKMIVVLDSVESMAVTMMITQLLAAPQEQITQGFVTPPPKSTTSLHDLADENSTLSAVATQTTMPGAFVTRKAEPHGLWVSGLRLVELSERTADVMQVMSGELLDGEEDPVVKVFSAFTRIHRIEFEGKLAVTPPIDRSSIVMSMSENTNDFLLVTWDDSEKLLVQSPELLKMTPNLRESIPQSHSKVGLVRDLFEQARCQVGVFIDRGFALSHQTATKTRRVYLPFFGGASDNLALGLAIYLAKNANVEVTVDVVAEVLTEVPTRASTVECERNQEEGETLTLLPSQAWDHVTAIYDALPSAMRAKFTLKRLDPAQSITESAQKAFDNESAISDLVLIGRATNHTANRNSRDYEPLMSSSASLMSLKSVTPTPGGDLFGAAAAELITSPVLKTSFFVCNARGGLMRPLSHAVAVGTAGDKSDMVSSVLKTDGSMPTGGSV